MNSNTDNRERLILILKKKGILPSHISDLLDVIMAPSSLIAFSRAIKTLENLLPIINIIDPEIWSSDRVDGFLEIVSECEALSDFELKELPGYCTPEKGKHLGLRGILSKYPLYSALCYRTDGEADSARFHQLQAHFLNASVYYRDMEREGKTYDSRLQETARLIRRLVSEPPYSSTLRLLPEAAMKMDVFYEWACTESRRNSISEFEQSNLHVIELMLSYALGRKSGTCRGRMHGMRVETRNQLVMCEAVDDADELSEPHARLIILTSDPDSNLGRELHLQGCSKVERLTGKKMVFDRVPLDLDHSVTPSIQAYRTHNKNRSITMNNQLLPMSWDRLNQQDIFGLFQGCSGLLAGSLDIGLGRDECQMLVALTAVMFWTSSSIERALNARIVRSIYDLPKNLGNSDLYFCMKESAWAIRSPELEQRRTADVSWQFQLRRSQSFILLPVGRRVQRTLQPMINTIADGIKSRSRPLFDEKADRIEDLLRVFLRQVNRKCHTRLTTLRITLHLFRAIADKSGDVGDAAIITGRQPSFGQATALYYYAPDSRHLQEIHLSVCRDIVGIVYESLGVRSIRNEVIKFPDVCFVGSQICPTERTVKLFVADLKAKMQHARKDLGNSNYLINLHNAYTSYCVSLLGFATGYRAVCDPLCSELDIDWQQGFAVICDKDSDDYYNTRVVWLPEVLLQQLKSYKAHRMAMAERLMLSCPETGQALLENGDAIPFLFYLRKNNKICRVSPTEISREIDWSSTLPLNANRHYLRTKLREKNVCGEVVDAFMGHWDTGQEPHGRYSSLSPISIQKHIENPLTELLNDACWSVVEGLS